jgi:hypothetical protein
MTTDHTELIKKLRRIADLAAEDALDLLDLADIEGPAREAAELLNSSDIRPKAKPRAEQPDPAVGQVWRNRSSGRLVKIVPQGFRRTDIYWEALSGRGPKRGSKYAPQWKEGYDYVETPEEGSTDG